MKFAEAMKIRRKFFGIRQEAFAKSLGLSRVTISRYENSKVEPKLKDAINISKALKFSLDEIEAN